MYGTHKAVKAIFWPWLSGKGLDRLRVGWLNGFSFSGRVTTRAEDAQGTPTQSHISPNILVYEDYRVNGESGPRERRELSMDSMRVPRNRNSPLTRANTLPSEGATT